jgi:hypothetical protein
MEARFLATRNRVNEVSHCLKKQFTAKYCAKPYANIAMIG